MLQIDLYSVKNTFMNTVHVIDTRRSLLKWFKRFHLRHLHIHMYIFLYVVPHNSIDTHEL